MFVTSFHYQSSMKSKFMTTFQFLPNHRQLSQTEVTDRLTNSANINIDSITIRDAFKKKIAQKETLVHSHFTPSLPSLNGTRGIGTQKNCLLTPSPPLAIGTNSFFLEVS